MVVLWEIAYLVRVHLDTAFILYFHYRNKFNNKSEMYLLFLAEA
jgi:hypothetical protein